MHNGGVLEVVQDLKDNRVMFVASCGSEKPPGIVWKDNFRDGLIWRGGISSCFGFVDFRLFPLLVVGHVALARCLRNSASIRWNSCPITLTGSDKRPLLRQADTHQATMNSQTCQFFAMLRRATNQHKITFDGSSATPGFRFKQSNLRTRKIRKRLVPSKLTRWTQVEERYLATKWKSWKP